MLKLSLQYFGHMVRKADSLEKTLMLGKIEGWRRRGQRIRWLDGITDSNSGSWWWAGRPGVQQSMGWQRVGHKWATELKSTAKSLILAKYCKLESLCQTEGERIISRRSVSHCVCVCMLVTKSHSLWSHELNPARLLCHGIVQARILEWVASSFSKGSSQPRDWTQVSHTAGRFFTIWTPHWGGGNYIGYDNQGVISNHGEYVFNFGAF